ncbi:MAG: N-acetylmuramoyl-L-alanine amidase [Lachnospiraceae bacterium]|nr:N-acetylmuramoyl-L-alanine amidase [Lachnospiraceae bacterium]
MMKIKEKVSCKWKIRQVGRFPYEAGLFSFCLLLVLSVCLYADTLPNVKAAETAADGEPASVPEDAAAGEEIEELPVEKLVVVIDPGHGGEEEGGMYDSFVEKDMTLITARAMKEELEKYEDVTVYLTREDDRKLSLEERVAYAKSVQADFLFCLHYNLSKDHNTLFGAECWVSAFGRHYSEGYAFADIEISALEDLGLYSRGIKTRIGKKGTDYYGIIRHAVEQDLTCVLIEHCHMDHANDRPFCEGREQWEAFGRLDAESAAKYFHLRSDTLGVDYSGYPVLDIPVPSGVMRPDTTEPDICMIEVTDQEMETGNVTVELSAVDYDSGMLYYDYSYDGGNTFFPRLAWGDKTKDTITFTMNVPPHIIPQIVVRGYNGYDLFTESNLVSLPSMDYKTEEEIAAELAEQERIAAAAKAEAEEQAKQNAVSAENQAKKHVSSHEKEEDKEPTISYFLTVCLVCALLVVGLALSMALILKSGKRRKRRRRRRRR